jgi:transcriptional regulator with XRE-family HTH domain
MSSIRQCLDRHPGDAASNSGLFDRHEPLRRDGADVLPAPDVLDGEPQVSGERSEGGPLGEDVGEGHELWDDTKRVGRQHYPCRETCDTSVMEPGDRLRQARADAGLTVEQLAERVQKASSTVRAHENGQNGIKAPMAARYARALNVSPEWLLYGRSADDRGPLPELSELPLLANTQAGAWLAVDDTGQEKPPMIPHAKDQAYPHARQWLREVQGDSMNAVGVMPGDLAHLVEFFGAGLENGMIVEVTRTRDGGSLREITLKEVEVSDRGVFLWPRSTNPRWKEAVRLNDDSGDDIQVEVTGILVATTRRFRRSRR